MSNDGNANKTTFVEYGRNTSSLFISVVFSLGFFSSIKAFAYIWCLFFCTRALIG